MKAKKKGIGFIILFILLAAVLGACIYSYPIWKDAGALRRHMAAGQFNFDLEVELDRTALEAGQEKLLENLAKLTGYEEDALFRLRIKGSARGDEIQALIYPEGEEEPLIELYLSDKLDAINETLPYNTIRKNLVEKVALLDHIMPAELEAVYMTLEQVEQIFDLDLSRIREFHLPEFSTDRSTAAYFPLLVLAPKERTEQGCRYGMEMEQVRMEVEIGSSGSGEDGSVEPGGGEKTGTVKIEFSMENPGELAEQQAALLSRLGMELPVGEMQMLKSISAVVEPGKGEAPTAPTQFVGQEKVDLIVEIRDLIREISDFFTP